MPAINDWRLPTVEEAMSIVATIENPHGLLVDAIFGSWVEAIWTGDACERRVCRVRFVADPYLGDTYEEKQDAVDLALKGLVVCVLGLLFPPLLLVGVFPLFFGIRKLAYSSMGLGLLDDSDL